MTITYINTASVNHNIGTVKEVYSTYIIDLEIIIINLQTIVKK